jgi:hypothetical protein
MTIGGEKRALSRVEQVGGREKKKSKTGDLIALVVNTIDMQVVDKIRCYIVDGRTEVRSLFDRKACPTPKLHFGVRAKLRHFPPNRISPYRVPKFISPRSEAACHESSYS